MEGASEPSEAPVASASATPEDELERRTAFLDALLESLNVGIVACDAKGVLTYFNRASREFHGLPERAIPASEWSKHYDLFAADGRTRLRPHEVPLARALAGEVVRNVEFVIAPSGLPARICLVSGRALVDPHGEKLGAVVAMHDITELRQAHQAIRESERFLESIVENLPNMIFVKDAAELRFVRFNRAGETLLGHPREALLGRNDYDFFPPSEADAFVRQDRVVLEGRVPVDIPEEPLSSAGLGPRVLHTKKIPIVGEDGAPKFLLGISEDITEKLRAQEQAVQLRIEQAAREKAEALAQELQEERKVREEFVALLSHDLRGPLQAIRVSADLLRRYPDRANAGDRLTNRIAHAVERADGMIQDMLDAHVIRSGSRLQLSFGECDLLAIVREALDELNLVHGERFVLEAAGRIEGWWNRSALRRVVDNLLTNAVKYGASDTPIVCACAADPALGEVRIKVHNDGPTIPPDQLTRLFAPFHRAPTASHEGRSGWGLGLVLVRGLAEAHGGGVRVESAEGQGTTFELWLPRDARAAPPG